MFSQKLMKIIFRSNTFCNHNFKRNSINSQKLETQVYSEEIQKFQKEIVQLLNIHFNIITYSMTNILY